MKKRILILIAFYLPGHKNGGPLRTVVNLTEALGDEYDFRIACLDRDLGDTEPYPDVEYRVWRPLGKAKVQYFKSIGFSEILRLSGEAELIYACSLFGKITYQAMLLNRCGRLRGKPLVVAPMGVFSGGAMAQKSLKKKLFVALFRAFGIFDRVCYSVSSPLEAKDLTDNIGKNARYIIAEDLPRTTMPDTENKEIGKNTIVFLSRISPKKNLPAAIRAVRQLDEPVVFDIYGPKEDADYWNTCEKELRTLPENIEWHDCGDVPGEDVQTVLAKYTFFLFPTLGENYGHVIFEALSAGCIPVISDQTPWGEIENRGAGRVLPLTDGMENFASALSELLHEPPEQRKQRSRLAVGIAADKIESSKRETGYRTVFALGDRGK